MSEKELKPCPCGKIPNKLNIMESHTSKWAYRTGGTMGEIEFRGKDKEGKRYLRGINI